MNVRITEATVAKLAQGDEDAFRQIYDCYFDVIYHFLRKKGGSAMLAEECTQATLSGVWDRRTEWTDVESLKHYICTMSRDYVLRMWKDISAMTVQLKETPNAPVDPPFTPGEKTAMLILRGMHNPNEYIPPFSWDTEIFRLAKAELGARQHTTDRLLKNGIIANG